MTTNFDNLKVINHRNQGKSWTPLEKEELNTEILKTNSLWYKYKRRLKRSFISDLKRPDLRPETKHHFQSETTWFPIWNEESLSQNRCGRRDNIKCYRYDRENDKTISKSKLFWCCTVWWSELSEKKCKWAGKLARPKYTDLFRLVLKMKTYVPVCMEFISS